MTNTSVLKILQKVSVSLFKIIILLYTSEQHRINELFIAPIGKVTVICKRIDILKDTLE